MGRFVFFFAALIAIAVVMNFRDYKKFEVNNERFDFQKTKAAKEAKLAELEALEEARLAAMEPKEEKAEVEEGPLVELTTEQLKRGSELYKKCIVCHGKAGQGKKSQNAPAIGGQFDWYVETQLTNMQNGTRVNAVMDPYIKKLSAEDIQDLAAYISKLPLMGKK